MNNKKTVLTISIVLGLGIIIGVGATELIVNNKKDTPSTTKTAISTKPLSPTLVVKNPAEYLNQQISLIGEVIQPNSTDTYIVGAEKEKPGAIKLDTTTNSISVQKFVTKTTPATGAYSKPSSPPPPPPSATSEKTSDTSGAGTKTVVVTGKVIRLASGQAVLVVQKIQ